MSMPDFFSGRGWKKAMARCGKLILSKRLNKHIETNHHFGNIMVWAANVKRPPGFFTRHET